MRGKVRHARKIRLSKIENGRGTDCVQQPAHRLRASALGFVGFRRVCRLRGFTDASGALCTAQRPSLYWHSYPAVRLEIVTVTTPRASLEYFSSICCSAASAECNPATPLAFSSVGSNGKRISSHTVTSPAGCPSSVRWLHSR